MAESQGPSIPCEGIFIQITPRSYNIMDINTSPQGSEAAKSQDSPLLRIPQEVLLEIATHLSPAPILDDSDFYGPVSYNYELLKLRTVCKELHSRTERNVGRIYFSYRRCNVSDREDLEMLCDISQHPVVSRTMRTITLRLLKMRDIFASRLRDDHLECDSAHDVEDEELDVLDVNEEFKCNQRATRYEITHHRPDLLELYNSTLNLQNEFLDRGGDSGFLHMILSNFRAAGNIVELSVGVESCDTCSSSFAVPKRLKRNGEGEREAFRACGFRFDLIEYDHRPFEIFSEAVRNSRYPVRSLNLGCEDVGVPLTTNGFILRNSNFGNLKELSLILEPQSGPFYDNRDWRNCTQTPAAYLVAFLRECRKLENVSLGALKPGTNDNGSQSKYRVDRLFAAVSEEVSTAGKDVRALQHIRELSLLPGLDYYIEDVLTCVLASRSTLKRLHIDQEIGSSDGTTSNVEFAVKVRDAYGSEDLELSGRVFPLEDLELLR